MRSYKENFNSPNSPLSSYSKTFMPEDEDVMSNFNNSICSEPANRKKFLTIIASSKNAIDSIILKSEKEWINTSNCGICSMIFDKLKGVFTHHCRVCGISVCGECSNKKINGARSCDLCFLRIESKDLIERKEKMLEMKDATRLEAEKNIYDLKERIDFFCKEISKVSSKQKEEEDTNTYNLDQLKFDLREVAGILKKKKDNMKNFQENLKNEEDWLKVKQQDFDKYRKEIARLKEDNLRKKMNINHGNDELRDLLDQIKRTQTTQSYLDLTEVFDISKEDLQRTFTQIETQNKGDQNMMLENCDVDIHNLLKKTISFQKRTYTSHSLLRSKLIGSLLQKAEIENEEKTIDGHQNAANPTGDCFGNSKCRIF